MLRSKILVLVAALLVVVLVVGVVVTASLESDRVASVKRTISGATTAVQAERYRRKAGTALLAESLAAGRLAVAMTTIEELRNQMLDAEEEAGMVAGAPSSEEALKIRSGFIASLPYSRDGQATDSQNGDEPPSGTQPNGRSLVEFFGQTLADRFEAAFGPTVFGKEGREAFVRAEAERFTSCLAVNTSQCMWDYSYMTMMAEIERLSRSYRIPIGQRVIVVDRRGIGIADSLNPKWSNQAGYADAHPLIAQVLKTGEARCDTITTGDAVNISTVVPVISNAEVVGAIAVLDPINRWMAADVGNLAGGASVIFATGEKVIDTSMDPTTASAILSGAAADKDKYFAAVFPFSGITLTPDLKLVLVVDTDEVRAPFTAAIGIFSAVVLVLILVALLLSALFMAAFYREVETIQKGVQEITSGKTDHKFPTDQKDLALRGLAQALNFMTSVFEGNSEEDQMLEDAQEFAVTTGEWKQWQVDDVETSTPSRDDQKS